MELLPNEQIKMIDEFPKYSITSFGRVWSSITCKWLTPTISKRGNHQRYYVSLGRGNKRFVHRLVAIAFIPNPNGLDEVDHIDGNGLNNNVTNLRWVTHQQNMENAITIDRVKNNTGYYAEIEEIATGKKFIGYDNLSKYTGLSKATLYKHTKNKIKNPRFKLTGKRFREKGD